MSPFLLLDGYYAWLIYRVQFAFNNVGVEES